MTPAGNLQSVTAKKLAMATLGFSFSLWFVISVFAAMNSTRWILIDSVFGFMMQSVSAFATLFGLVAVFFSLNILTRFQRIQVMSSLIAFAVVNIVGFVALFSFSLVRARGQYSISWSAFQSIWQQGIIFVCYLAIFGLFLSPLLLKRLRRLLLVPSLFGMIYVSLMVSEYLALYSQPMVMVLPGIIYPPLGQLYSPVFGLPGDLLSNGIYNFGSWYAMLSVAASNASYAVLCLITALKRDRA